MRRAGHGLRQAGARRGICRCGEFSRRSVESTARDGARAKAMTDPRTFRNVLGRFATGVSIIAIGVDEGVHAMTANAVCALSLAPPQVLFCPSKASRLSQMLTNGGLFTISFLREEQEAISIYFA